MLDYCDLDTIIDGYTLVTKRRTLITYYQVHGSARYMGDTEFVDAIARLELLFNNLLSSSAHALQWVFTREPSRASDELEFYLDPLQHSAKAQGLDQTITGHMLNERKRVLQQYVSPETCLLTFMTLPQALGNIELKQQAEDNKNDPLRKKRTELGVPANFGHYAQSFPLNLNRLNIIHQAAQQALENILMGSGINLSMEKLEVHEALNKTRRLHAPDETARTWRPSLPGDPLPMHDKPVLGGEQDNCYYPVIGAQLFKRSAQIEQDVVKIGEHYWATTEMDLSQQEPKRFDELFKMLPKNLDWRLSIGFIGGDLSYAQKIKTRRAIARLFKVTNRGQNEPIDAHCSELLAIRDNGEMLVGYRLQLSVRALSHQKANEGINLCARLLQAWGNCDTSFERGDPVEALISTLPGLDRQAVGKTLIQPSRESLITCPFTRPVSPWRDFGDTLYRTQDGRLYPVKACSSQQHAWISLVFAPPGSGKSVLQNSKCFNLCFTPGLSRLPKISILDIGPSSQGLIELLHAILPNDRQGEAVHKTLKQDKASSINPFDTLLGMREPHAAKFNFLKNFLAVLFTEEGQSDVAEGLGELISELIKETYKRYSDDHDPKTYDPYIEPQIDDIIARNPDWFVHDEQQKLTWWQIVDALAQNEQWELASLAQRHAVPLLGDLTGILHSSQALKDIYAKTEKDKDIYDHLLKMVRAALSTYVILTCPTQFNVGQARVVALDLADVTGGSSSFGLKKSGLMYMLGREVLVGGLYFGEGDIAHLPKIYQDYHQANINESLGDIKTVCYDEFHRTSGLNAVKQQVCLDMREGRKYKVALSLASQRYADFDETMLELATEIYICNGASGNTLDQLTQTFALSDSEKKALKFEVKGATKEGASFLYKAYTKKEGWLSQVLVNSISLFELWAFASTADDVVLRKRLLRSLPYFTVIMLLAAEFPSGSAKDALDEQVKARNCTKEEILDEVIARLLKRAEKNQQELMLGSNAE